MITRKDFTTMANTLANLVFDGYIQLEKVEEDIDAMNRKLNPNYDPKKFWKAVSQEYLRLVQAYLSDHEDVADMAYAM